MTEPQDPRAQVGDNPNPLPDLEPEIFRAGEGWRPHFGRQLPDYCCTGGAEGCDAPNAYAVQHWTQEVWEGDAACQAHADSELWEALTNE